MGGMDGKPTLFRLNPETDYSKLSFDERVKVRSAEIAQGLEDAMAVMGDDRAIAFLILDFAMAESSRDIWAERACCGPHVNLSPDADWREREAAARLRS